MNKRHPGIKHINTWVMAQYELGRTTSISNQELIAQVKHFLPSLFESDSVKVRKAAISKALYLADKISSIKEFQSLDSKGIEEYLEKVVKKEGSIQLIAVTDLKGQRISQVHTQRGEKGRFRALLNKNFHKHEWFTKVVNAGEPHHSDLFFSKYTGLLIMTAAHPLRDKSGNMFAVMDIDFKFDELVKLLSDIPDEILESVE